MGVKDTIEIDVNVGEGVKSMKTLKKEFAEMQTELDGLIPGTQKYIQTLQKLGAVKDEIGDLKAEIQAFAGTDAKVAAFGSVISGVASGFQAAQGAAALFGAESEDVQKALLKVQAAAALSSGIQGITAMGDSLKVAANVAKQLITQILGVETVTKIAAIAQRVWNAVMAANPIGLIVVAVTAFIGVVYGLVKAFEDSSSAADKAEQSYQRLAEANKEITKQLDNEIVALGGIKANEEEIIALKKKKFEQDIAALKLGIAAANQKAEEQEKELSWFEKIGLAVNKFNGVQITEQQIKKANSAESVKLAKERTDELKRMEAEYSNFNNTEIQKGLDKTKEANEKYKQLAQERLNDRKAAEREAIAYTEQLNKERLSKEEQEKKERDKEEDEQIEKDIQKDFKRFEKDKEDRLERQKKYDEEVKASNAATKEAEYKSVDALRSISEGFFAFRLRAAKGNEEEELKIRKRMFAVDKAFNIARAIQDGIRSVQAALTIPPPGGQILAGINAAIAAGNVAKIAATEFNGGGGSASISSGGGGNANFSQAPQISNASSQRTTAINDDGTVANSQRTAPLQAYVVESQAAATSKRINKLTNQSKVG